jgi:hypothetical protein
MLDLKPGIYFISYFFDDRSKKHIKQDAHSTLEKKFAHRTNAKLLDFIKVLIK